jgi:hypothetical protein
MKRKWENRSHLTAETHSSWLNMRQRCLNPAHQSYPSYGGRGITVCDRWKDNYDAFYTDMGPRPKGMTLERVDNEQGYDPFNCVWATRKTQSRNTRTYKRKITEHDRDWET